MGSSLHTCFTLTLIKNILKSNNMPLAKEVTKGVFDPRTYREDDPVNWARKRRSDWLATPGQIHYARERTVDRDLEEAKQRQEGEAPREAEPSPTPEREIIKMPPVEVPVRMNIERKPNHDPYWPRKMRSDITRSRVI